jgi:hypothetical protein
MPNITYSFAKTCLLLSLLACLSACGGYKTAHKYTKTLAKIDKMAVLTPYSNVENLYLENDFKHEKPTLDSVGIKKGIEYIQHQTVKALTARFNAYPVQLEENFQKISKPDVLLMLQQLDKRKLRDVIMPAYLNEFLKKQQISYVALLYHIGTYKSTKRSEQDDVMYNTKEALDGIFSATSPTNSSVPNFPDDAVSILHIAIYDVINKQFLYYDKEVNYEISEANIPMPAKATDKQLKEILKKLLKDCVKNNFS